MGLFDWGEKKPSVWLVSAKNVREAKERAKEEIKPVIDDALVCKEAKKGMWLCGIKIEKGELKDIKV